MEINFTLWDLVSALTLVSVIVGCIFIGRKLQILDDLQKTMEKIKTNIKIACDALIKSEVIEFNGTDLQTYSPFQITEEGKQKINDLGFEKIFEDNKKDFFDFIDAENPKSKYDIEAMSIKAVFSLFNKDYFRGVKEYLYNNPTYGTKQMITLLGVHVRDKYLEDHPEIES